MALRGAIFWHSLSLPEVQEQEMGIASPGSPYIRPLIGGFMMISKPSSFLTFKMRHRFVNIHRQIALSESLKKGESRKTTENMLDSGQAMKH